MIVVLPFCKKDQAQACKVLDWAEELDGRVNHECLLSYDTDCDPSEVLIRAQSYFSAVFSHVYEPWCGDTKWPRPQNNAFQRTAWHIFQNHKIYRNQSWLWWEVDGIPLKAGWLRDIELEYLRGKQPFMGYKSPTRGNFNGQAVYPWNVPERTKKLLLWLNTPWDWSGSEEVIPQMHVANHIFQHRWADENKEPYTFPDWPAVLAVVDLTCCLFHRNKDGSLVDRLRETRAGKPKMPEPVYEPERVDESQIGAVETPVEAVRKGGPAERAIRRPRRKQAVHPPAPKTGRAAPRKRGGVLAGPGIPSGSGNTQGHATPTAEDRQPIGTNV